MKNQIEIKKWEEEFEKKFSTSDFWIDSENYPKNYNSVKKFIKELLNKHREEIREECETQYRDFIKEMNSEHKDELLKQKSDTLGMIEGIIIENQRCIDAYHYSKEEQKQYLKSNKDLKSLKKKINEKEV